MVNIYCEQSASPAKRQTYADQLLERIALEVASIDDPVVRLATQVGKLQGELRKVLPAEDRLLPGSRFCRAEIDGLGDCIVHYDYSPGRFGRNYMPNGDPGYPDELPELTVTVVQVGGCEFSADVFSADVQERLDIAAQRDVERIAEAEQADRYEAEQREMSLWGESMGETQ